jgi:hypothetical protein
VTIDDAGDAPAGEDIETTAVLPQPDTAAEAAPIPRQRARTGGPTPSAVRDGLSEEGLVQRRRTVPRRRPQPPPGHPGRAPARAQPDPEAPRPQDLAEAVVALAKAADPPAPAERPTPGANAAVLDPSTTDGLPRRVRQASLAPQLRAPVEPEPDTVPLRSPDQVRELMSALQRGTTRGRLAARGIDPDASPGAAAGTATNGTSGFAEATTVRLQVVQNRAEHEDEDHGQPAGHDGTRPDKDS